MLSTYPMQTHASSSKRFHLKRWLLYILACLATMLSIVYYLGESQWEKIETFDKTVEYGTILTIDDVIKTPENRFFPISLNIEDPKQDGIRITDDSIELTNVGAYSLHINASIAFHGTITKEINLKVVDSTPPKVESIHCDKSYGYKENIPVEVGTATNPTGIYVHATDFSGIKSYSIYSIETTSGEKLSKNVDYTFKKSTKSICINKPGTYKVCFTISDTYNNRSSAYCEVDVIDNISPILTLKRTSFEIEKGDKKPSYVSYVIANDHCDGNLNSKITVDDSMVNYQKSGKYSVQFSVCDSSGNYATANATVNISEPKNNVIEVLASSSGASSSSGSRSTGSIESSSSSKKSSSGSKSSSKSSSSSKSTSKKSSSSGSGSGSSKDNGSDSGSDVLITKTGKCYHRRACGRGNYYYVSLSYAKSRGLRKCQKCY